MNPIEQLIRDMNAAWLAQNHDALYPYFHKDVVMVPPGGDIPIVGVEAMVQSYRDFNAMGTIHDFKILEVNVYHYSGVCMCHMRFEVDYEIEAGRFSEKGQEIYAIENAQQEPKIVWRTQIS